MTTQPATVTWHTDPGDLPDDEVTVLLLDDRDHMHTGGRSAGEWLTDAGDVVPVVVAWADLPDPPRPPGGDLVAAQLEHHPDRGFRMVGVFEFQGAPLTVRTGWNQTREGAERDGRHLGATAEMLRGFLRRKGKVNG